MSLTSIKAGEATVEINADDSKLVKGLNSAKSHISSWVPSIATIAKAAAAAAGAGLAMLVKHAADTASEIQDLADKTGISAKSISTLKYAAGQTGTELGGLQAAMRNIAKELDAGGKAFQKYGIDVDRFRQLSPEDQFKTVAEAVSRITDPTARAAAAMDMLGKSGQDLIPLLSGGSSGIHEMQREAERLGLSMSNEAAASGEKFGDSLATVVEQVKMLGVKIGTALIPHLQPLIDRVIEINAAFLNWMDESWPKLEAFFKFISDAIGRDMDALVAMARYLSAGDLVSAAQTAAMNFALVWIEAANMIAKKFQELWNSDYFQGVIEGNQNVLEALGVDTKALEGLGNNVAAGAANVAADTKKKFDALVKRSEPGADLEKRGTDTPGRLALAAAQADPAKAVETSQARLALASVGTFNARAAGGLAGNSDTAAIRVATQQTARNTARLAAAGGAAAVVFGA